MAGEPGARHRSRRDFLRKSAVAGGLLWVAPAVTRVSAHAATGSPAPNRCSCVANAFGLQVLIPRLGINQTFGVGGCVAGPFTVGAGDFTVLASAVCGSAKDCSAQASIGLIEIHQGRNRIRATLLTSAASSSCSPCHTTGSSHVATLRINNANVAHIGACNASFLSGALVVNEETCTGNTLSVNALHFVVPGLIEVIAAHTDAVATACPCVTC